MRETLRGPRHEETLCPGWTETGRYAYSLPWSSISSKVRSRPNERPGSNLACEHRDAAAGEDESTDIRLSARLHYKCNEGNMGGGIYYSHPFISFWWTH